MLSIEKAKQRVFDKCNLIGDSVDIYEVIYSFKALANLDPEEIELVYDEIAENLGFCNC